MRNVTVSLKFWTKVAFNFLVCTLFLLQLVKTILEELSKTKGVRQNMLEVNLNGKQIMVK